MLYKSPSFESVHFYTDNIFLISNNTTITLNYNYFQLQLQLQLQASNLSFKGFTEIAADA